MIEKIRKIWSDDNIKEMACEYTLAEEEYQGFILGCNVLADEIEEQVKKYSIPNVSKSLPTEDAEFIYSLLPDWVKNKAPEGLDPTMYGTLSKEGDDEIQERVKQILSNIC